MASLGRLKLALKDFTSHYSTLRTLEGTGFSISPDLQAEYLKIFPSSNRHLMFEQLTEKQLRMYTSFTSYQALLEEEKGWEAFMTKAGHRLETWNIQPMTIFCAILVRLRLGWTFGLLAHQLQVDKKTLTGQINRSLKSTAAYFREKYVYLPRSYEAVMDNVWVLLCFAAASSRRYLQITPHCSFLLYCRFQSL
jgi:hypothetical protein